jgi:gliding motility-associated-like protein
MINALQLHATNDTTIILNQPFQLTAGATYSGSAQLNYNWSPTIGLNDPASATPVTILQDDQVYYLTVRSADGCVAKDTINLTVFKGSNIFVPSGFTPNRDGKNDLLHPGYYGIKQLNYFTIYNRWGQQVFTTKSLSAGWDGRFQGQNQEGTFVWILSATDFVGKKYSLKGTTTIVR